MKRLLSYSAAAFVLMCSTGFAGTLENLERERAMTVQTMLDGSLTVEQRGAKLDTAKRRLVDLERMVLRDEGLKGRTDQTTRVAFKNYDVTFLAHASLEKNRSLSDHWLDQFGISTDSLMATKIGRR